MDQAVTHPIRKNKTPKANGRPTRAGNGKLVAPIQAMSV